MNTHELEGAALDYWVAKALGLTCRLMKAGERLANVALSEDTCVTLTEGSKDWYQPYHPSSVWFFAGPIIQQVRIATWADEENWCALLPGTGSGYYDADLGTIDANHYDAMSGPTPLVAAMRALVQSEFGDFVTFQ